ncbi:radical SAM protein [Candidatus Termititenax persephonae]|uniref:Radical SAM protein n=1 Tax=Candidatus Termititenax persephonae TaxID=2218525 RepID=A0A388TJV8_9BACT|nr:radical SAM protein [Candidatus Termititenax persephonae]
MPRSGNETTCLFGPVRSRRLGHSLGIDLLKFKTCTLDCAFCECGRTTQLTDTRQVFIPTEKVLQELDNFFVTQDAPEVLTFSGGGEPTLAKNLGALIRQIKRRYPSYKLCLLTNSTLLPNPQVRAEILPVDIIIPSLNAVSPKTFNQINRPLDGLTPAPIMDGLLELKKNYTGQLLLEIFIVPGVNDGEAELAKLRDFAAQLQPDGIQLNSLDRRGAEAWVQPVSAENMQKIKEIFKDFNTNYYLKR